MGWNPTISEARPGPEKGSTVRDIRKRRRKVGQLLCYRDAAGQRRHIATFKVATWAYHKASQAWYIEADLIDLVRNFACTHVHLQVEDGSRLLIPFRLVGRAGAELGVSLYSEPPTNPKAPATRKWLIPEALFAATRPPTDERDDALVERMRIKGGSL